MPHVSVSRRVRKPRKRKCFHARSSQNFARLNATSRRHGLLDYGDFFIPAPAAVNRRGRLTLHCEAYILVRIAGISSFENA
jgi:hypothetical protein